LRDAGVLVLHLRVRNELGGHVRIGFENNIVMADGSIAPNYVALVRQFTSDSNVLARSPANAAEVRAAFSLPGSD
jgi:3-keto-5-aminohexanoate cleavage enzyme